MACGNNNVSRGYLSSQPTPPSPSSASQQSASRQQRALPSSAFPKAGDQQWYSSYNRRGEVQVLLDKEGKPTTGYPHVHVVHDPNKGQVRMHNTLSKGVHVDGRRLPGNASGTQVNAAVNDLLAALKRRSR